MPACSMDRIITHWTAGAHTANSTDLAHYHILIEGDGRIVRGSYSIKDNVDTSDGRYAAHCKNCNTGSIGVSLCCMANATENPFNPGHYPMTSKQWDVLSTVVAELCNTYGIPVGPSTVLTHAEVQGTLGIAQSGKWDYTRLAFDPTTTGARDCGDKLRDDVKQKQDSVAMLSVETAASPEPTIEV
jgi:N-acetyl-anhydromuramyl-L-alanine amidase AmpD